MKKILMIGMTDNRGGIESFIINYYRKINRNKFNMEFVNIYQSGLFFEKEILDNGDCIYNLPSYYKHPIKYIMELKKIIQENQYAVVYCNMNSAVMLFPLIGAKLAKTNSIIVCHAHNTSSDKGILKKIMHFFNKRFIPLFADKYVGCSDKAGEWFFSKKIRDSKDYYIINNSIDADIFKFNEDIRKKIRKQLGCGDSTLVIGHVGRFNKQKNHEYLIDIYAKICSEVDSKLILLGIGDEMNHIRKKVKELNIAEKVCFLGLVDNASEYYQAMDVFVLPSLYEGFPLVCVEAQCSGVKCIFSSKITPQVKLSPNTYFLPLDSNTKKWEEEIKELNNNYPREDGYNNIVKMGYDLNTEVEKFEEFLIKWSEQNDN